jgi:hypothetical protein
MRILAGLIALVAYCTMAVAGGDVGASEIKPPSDRPVGVAGNINAGGTAK